MDQRLWVLKVPRLHARLHQARVKKYPLLLSSTQKRVGSVDGPSPAPLPSWPQRLGVAAALAQRQLRLGGGPGRRQRGAHRGRGVEQQVGADGEHRHVLATDVGA